MNFNFLLEEDHKAAATYLLTLILSIILGGLTLLSHTELVRDGGKLLFMAAVCALVALIVVALSDALTGFVAAGFYSFVCLVMAFMMIAVGQPAFFAVACISGGIALIIAVPRKKIAWAITGWAVFALGFYVLQNLLF